MQIVESRTRALSYKNHLLLCLQLKMRMTCMLSSFSLFSCAKLFLFVFSWMDFATLTLIECKCLMVQTEIYTKYPKTMKHLPRISFCDRSMLSSLSRFHSLCLLLNLQTEQTKNLLDSIHFFCFHLLFRSNSCTCVVKVDLRVKEAQKLKMFISQVDDRWAYLWFSKTRHKSDNKSILRFYCTVSFWVGFLFHRSCKWQMTYHKVLLLLLIILV